MGLLIRLLCIDRRARLMVLGVGGLEKFLGRVCVDMGVVHDFMVYLEHELGHGGCVERQFSHEIGARVVTWY